MVLWNDLNACVLLLSLIALQPGIQQRLRIRRRLAWRLFPSGFVLLPMATAGLGSVPLELLVCPLSICRLSLQSAPNTFLIASLSHLLCGSNLRISRPLTEPPSQNLTCIWDSFCSMGSAEICFPTTFAPNVQFVVTVYYHAVFLVSCFQCDI